MKQILRKFNRLSLPAKALLALVFSQLVQKGLPIITEPIYTRLLNTSEYGTVSLFLSWHEILVIFTSLCLSKGVFNNGMMDYKNDRDVFTLSLYTLSCISTIFIGIPVILFSTFIYNFMDLSIELILYMFILLFFEQTLALWTVRQRFEYKYMAVTVLTIVLTVLAPLSGIVGVLVSENKVFARIICEKNIFIISYIGVLILIIKKAKGKINLLYWKYALKFNIPLIPHYLSLHILNHMDRIQIAFVIGKSAAGIYSIAYSGAAAIKIFWQAINASLIPWTYEKCSKKDFKKLKDLTEILILGFGLLCVFFMFLAPEVMKILAPVSYHEGIYVIPSVVAGVYFSVMYYVFANIVYYYKKPKYVMIGSCCSAVINVILNAIFIPIFGYLAAGYTTMFAYGFQAFIDYYALRKVIGKDIYDKKFLLMTSSFVVFVAILLNYIYDKTFIRLGLVGAILLYTIYYFSKNKDIFSMFFQKK